MKVGDIVARKSYNKDIVFKITDIIDQNGKKIAILKGVAFRIIADAELSDLELLKPPDIRNILMDNIEEVNNIAINVLWENGFDYEAKTMISRENFPDKVYGDYLFPQGNYEAFRIIIGNGEGHNWWCVMFPPLCFVDETKGDVDSSNLKEVLVDDNDEENNNIKCKFKIVELIKDILKNN